MESAFERFGTTQAMGRREWWRTCFRWGALAALSGVVATLGLRASNPDTAVACRLSTCRGCGRAASCTLPRAVAFRHDFRGRIVETRNFPQ